MKHVGMLVAFVLAGMTVTASAFAETIAQKVPPCPPVYGTWRTTHVTDKFGNAQPLPIPRKRQGLIMEARIDQDKAVLVWFGGKKKMTFKRWYKYRQWDGSFVGLNDSHEMDADTEFDPVIDYPNDKCYLQLGYSLDKNDIGSLDQRVLMEKVE